jgi:hypothetical protein
MIRIAVHKCEGAVLVAACDSELVGKKLSEGKLRLEVCEGFYGCDEYEEGALTNYLRVCSSANLAGKRTVAAAVKAGFIDKGSVLVIDGVPHAHLYVV